MEATYKVTIKTKRGFPMPDADKVRTAVFGTGVNHEAIADVAVEKVEKPKGPKVDVIYAQPLFAVGRKAPGVKEWMLFYYCDTEKKALNAAEKSRRRFAECLPDDPSEFAAFAACPAENRWRKLKDR